MIVRRIVCVMALVVLLAAGNAAAQCSSPDNWLTSDECGFDTPTSVAPDAWRPIAPVFPGDPDYGIPVHSATGGRTSPGTMQIDAVLNPDMFGDYYAAGAWLCLDNQTTSPGDVVGFGMYINPDAVAAGGINCTLWVSTDPSSDCSVGFNDYGMSQPVVTTAGDWIKLNSEQSFMNVATGGSSIYISIACLDYSGTQDFILSVDDVYVGINMVPVELQSFTIE